jgi:phosphoglycerate dehydrogenase-like enzyme
MNWLTSLHPRIIFVPIHAAHCRPVHIKMMNRSILRTTVRLQSRMMSASAPVIDGPLGFVGLGHMGSKMVENLSRDGRKIMVYDASKEAVQKVVSASAAGNKSVTAASLEEMAQKCSIIFSMLPNDQVRQSSKPCACSETV